MQERRRSLLHGWGAGVEKGMKSREGRAKAERARVLSKLQGVCSSHWSSSTLQASPARRPETLRTTHRRRTCHSAATRPPADGTRALP